MVGNYNSVFGGAAVRPSQPSYLALTMAANTTLFWPLETMEGVPYLAAQVDVTASSNGLDLILPPANQGSPGAQSVVTNVGADSFTLTDNAGNAIVAIAAGISWLVTLLTNGSAAGTWRAYQLGATASNANAGALAGLGLQANAGKLQVELPPFGLSANTLLTTMHRAGFIVWTGAAGTLQLDASATNTAGWFCLVASQGTDEVTISCTGGDLINGQPTLVLEVGNSAIIECSGTGYNTVATFQSPLSVLNGGTGANNAPGALTNLGGTSIGTSIFTAPSAASVLATLGITGGTFTESSVSTNQAITSGNSQTAFVCTAALAMTLPLTSGGGGLTKSFCMAIFAAGGAVTLTPTPSDKINGGTLGGSLVLTQGCTAMLMTDTNGNWYVFFNGVTQGTFVVTPGNAALWGGYNVITDAGKPPALLNGVGTNGNIPKFINATTITDSAVPINELVLLTGVPAANQIAVWTNANTVQASAFSVTQLPLKSGVPTAGNLASWLSATTLQDAGAALSALVLLTAFTTGQVLGNPGNQPLPGGLILKWGTVFTSGAADVAVAFATAFPNALFGVVAIDAASGANSAWASTNTPTAAGFNIAAFTAINTRAAVTAFWVALGN